MSTSVVLESQTHGSRKFLKDRLRGIVVEGFGYEAEDCFFKLECGREATEKAMASHSSTLSWKIPWTEEPGRLQSMGSLRVGHD